MKYQQELTTGVTGIGEYVEIDDGTQEIHKILKGLSIHSTSAKHEAVKTVLWKSESVIVVMQQVMIVERRAGR